MAPLTVTWKKSIGPPFAVHTGEVGLVELRSSSIRSSVIFDRSRTLHAMTALSLSQPERRAETARQCGRRTGRARLRLGRRWRNRRRRQDANLDGADLERGLGVRGRAPE